MRALILPGITLLLASQACTKNRAWEGFEDDPNSVQAVSGDWTRPEGAAPPKEEESEPANYGTCEQPEESIRSDYELKLGIGFDATETKIFELAAKKWAEQTSLPITVTHGHGLEGKIHLFDSMDACGEGKAHTAEDALGCYIPPMDRLAFSRPGIKEFAERLRKDAGPSASSGADRTTAAWRPWPSASPVRSARWTSSTNAAWP
jgi:hypothetical protein